MRVYDYETRRMCQAIERELELARAQRLMRLGHRPASISFNLLAPLRRLWSRRPHPATPVALPMEHGALSTER